jgi:hypothetical protein
MGTFDTPGWDWGYSEYSEVAVADSGPWVWWLPVAWRAVADPLGAHPLPPPPGPLDWEAKGGPRSHSYTLAWWAPLLHLLFFGLGWVRPDLGLARWLDCGQPDDDPVLRTVKRWWGPHVTDLLTWAGRLDTLSEISAGMAHAVGTAVKPVFLPGRWSERHPCSEWEKVWGGGGDSLHLGRHVTTPVQFGEHRPGQPVLATDLAGAPRASLSLSGYQGWYSALAHYSTELPSRADGRSWRVSVVIRPLGSLGIYRQSRQTQRWFSGRHRWHQLGLDEAVE